ncbi:hypothetical protein VV02_02510 [Luteipulveratus mongoliensis]|uniref:Superoxide dismutase n=1 Tax=Luteipulveratus mongoliensis TaxID=571913 RepID=A0A0K1JPR8_9MICO|nr:hypothetical protein VV02_02510 [Luteipulveratus mongoliensis]
MTTLTLTVAGTSSATANPTPHPTSYTVSTTPGEHLEGIEVTHDGTIYVTSVATGAIYRGSTRSSQLRPWSPAGAGGRTSATGVHVDRWGRVLVAGASTGTFFVYDRTGRLLQTRHVPLAGDSFLNDFAFTHDAVYITDSASGTVYRASLSASGVGPLVPVVRADDFTPKASFINGIAVTPDQQHLIVSDWGVDVTHRVDLSTHHVSPVRIAGGEALGADGLLLRGHTAYAVQTDWTRERTWVRTVRFDATFTTAKVVNDSPEVGFDQSPTTIARDRGRLLWVNSQLNAAVSRPPFTVSEVPAS